MNKCHKKECYECLKAQLADLQSSLKELSIITNNLQKQLVTTSGMFLPTKDNLE